MIKKNTIEVKKKEKITDNKLINKAESIKPQTK